jgi:hypothetical protein
MFTLAGSADTHARQGQAACGLAVNGVFGDSNNNGAAASPALAMPVSTPTGAAPTRTMVTVLPTTPTPTPSATRRVTPTRTATPKYTASPAELARAEARVARAQQEYQETPASPNASKTEREIAADELEAADQRLADLKAGRPGARHRKLEIRGAKAYLALAEEQYRRAMVDPTASEADRADARAHVITWRSTLKRVQG